MASNTNRSGSRTLTAHLLLSAYKRAKEILINLLRRLLPFCFSLSRSPWTERVISIRHVIITSRRSFEETKEALENLAQPQDFSWRPLAQSGKFDAAWQALNEKSRPPRLGSFLTPPRNLGALAEAVRSGKGNNGKATDSDNGGSQAGSRRALQYQIGNPVLAGKMILREGGVGCYAPITVLLRETESDGQVIFEYDRPRSTMGQSGNRVVDGTAREVDEELMRILLSASGYEDGTSEGESKNYRAVL